MNMTATQHGFGPIAWRLVLAIVGPFVVMSAFIILSRWPFYRPTPAIDRAGLIIAILVGFAALVTLPAHRWIRVLSVTLYVPIFGAVLFAYCLWIVGLLFGEFL
jgi:hypothetical protein